MLNNALHIELSSSVQLNESQDFDCKKEIESRSEKIQLRQEMMIAYLQEPFKRLSKFVKRRGCYDLHKAGLYFIIVALFRHFSSTVIWVVVV